MRSKLNIFKLQVLFNGFDGVVEDVKDAAANKRNFVSSTKKLIDPKVSKAYRQFCEPEAEVFFFC